MGEGIPQQQQGLKEQQTRRPNGRATAKPWKDVFADQWLYLKQKERADEDCEAIAYHALAYRPSNDALPNMRELYALNRVSLQTVPSSIIAGNENAFAIWVLRPRRLQNLL